MSISLNDDELAALAQASPEFMRLYVLGLRPTMDFRTGLCGERYGVAYSQLGLNVAYKAPPGSRRPSWHPSRDNVISLFDEGKRLGMLRVCSPAGRRQLVFELVLADRGSFVSGRTPTGRPHHETHMTPRHKAEENQRVDGDSADLDAHTRIAEDAPMSGSPVSDIGNSSGGGKDRSTQDASAPTTTDLPVPMAERAATLCKSLRRFRFVVQPSQFRHVGYREMLEQFTDDEILGAARAVHERPGVLAGQTFNLPYLLKVVGDIVVARAAPAPLSRRSSARRGMGGSAMPWFMSWPGIEEKARELGLTPGKDELPPEFKFRVYAAAGLTHDEYRRAEVDFGGRG